jgi:hypothetical protein
VERDVDWLAEADEELTLLLLLLEGTDADEDETLLEVDTTLELLVVGDAVTEAVLLDADPLTDTDVLDVETVADAEEVLADDELLELDPGPLPPPVDGGPDVFSQEVAPTRFAVPEMSLKS